MTDGGTRVESKTKRGADPLAMVEESRECSALVLASRPQTERREFAKFGVDVVDHRLEGARNFLGGIHSVLCAS